MSRASGSIRRKTTGGSSRAGVRAIRHHPEIDFIDLTGSIIQTRTIMQTDSHHCRDCRDPGSKSVIETAL